MWYRSLKHQRAGRPISARQLNEVAEAGEWSARIEADWPLELTTTGFAPLLRYDGPVYESYIAMTSGAVPGRVGTTPGDGAVILQGYTGTDLVPDPNAPAIPVLNFSSGEIPDGKYCVVERIDSELWITSVEC